MTRLICKYLYKKQKQICLKIVSQAGKKLESYILKFEFQGQWEKYQKSKNYLRFHPHWLSKSQCLSCREVVLGNLLVLLVYISPNSAMSGATTVLW